MRKRKKLILLSAVLFTSACIISSFYTDPNTGKWNDLTLNNIEALSQGENTGPIACIASGSVECPVTFFKVRYVVR